MIRGEDVTPPERRDRKRRGADLRSLFCALGVGVALFWGASPSGRLTGVASAQAERLADVFPDLRLDSGSRRYDYIEAQSAADRLLWVLRQLSGYSCRTRTFYSLKRLPPGINAARQSRGGVRPRPDESFDLTIRYAPLSVAVRLRHPRKGATVLYRSVDGVAVVRPFGFLPLKLSLSPKSSLITSRFGHTIDHADFLSYDRRILRPACLTHSCLLLATGQLGGRAVLVINVAPDQLEARPVFGRMWLLLDRETALPVSVASEGPNGHFWERIDYWNCRLFKKERTISPTVTR